MFNFKDFLTEAKKKEEGDFKTGDSAGKLFELLKAKEQNGGTFPESHRVKGKTPTDIHNKMAAKMFGDEYEKHPQYKNLVKTAQIAAKANDTFNQSEHGHDVKKGYQRVAWTSQPADHQKETGHEDPNSVADSIPTLSHGAMIAHSDKLTGKGQSVNYKNPGSKTMEMLAQTSLKKHTEPHAKLLKDKKLTSGEEGHEQYKALRDSDNPEDQETAASVKKSADVVNQKFAKDIHAGLLAQQARDAQNGTNELRDTIIKGVAPKTHLKTVVTHTEVDNQGNHAHTKVYDLHDHVNQYLNNFENLHVDPVHKQGQSSVTVYGHHKKTGKRMRLMGLSVYSGGRPTTISPRGAITLPSENHPDVEYTNHHIVGANGEHETNTPVKQKPSVEKPVEQKKTKTKEPNPRSLSNIVKKKDKVVANNDEIQQKKKTKQQATVGGKNWMSPSEAGSND